MALLRTFMGLAVAVVAAVATTESAPASSIPTVTLNNGVRMPAISAGSGRYDAPTAEAAIAAALRVGFRAIDDAFNYYNQMGVGRAIAASGLRREDLFITTKVPGCGRDSVSRHQCGPDSVRAFAQSLQQLNVSYVDLLLVHFPPPGGCGPLNCPVIQQQWQALEALVATKQVRALGVSNFCQSCFQCLDKLPGGPHILPAVNQVQFHIGGGADPQGLVSYCRGRGIVVEAYSPLGGPHTKAITHGNATTAIGAAHKKSAVQAALRWIWQHGVPLAAESTNPVHLAQNLEIFDFALSDAEMAQLDAATAPSYQPSFMCSS